jgi:cardiolipin synthase
MSNLEKTKIFGKRTNNFEAELVESGNPFFLRLASMINEAEHWIHLQFYIFQTDKTGEEIGNHLIRARNRGVEIFILMDAIGSPKISEPLFQSMIEAGIKMKIFSPVNFFSDGYLSRRLHHKIAVTDKMEALIGGINIANRYNDLEHEPAWMDLAVWIKSSICVDIKYYCIQIWKEQYGDKNRQMKKHGKIEFLRNDWLYHLNEISIAYLNLFKGAKHDIILVCSYFIPGKALRRSIEVASKKGVTIKLITTARSDVPFSKHAERWLYDWLFRNQIQIFEFQKTILHAKMAISDSKKLIIGSYNINNLSAYGSLECNLEIDDESFASMTSKNINTWVQTNCSEIKKNKSGRKYPFYYQFICWISFKILQMILYLSSNGFHRKSVFPKTLLK